MQIIDQGDDTYAATLDQVVRVMNSCFPDYQITAVDVTMVGDAADRTWRVPVPPGMYWVWDNNPEGSTSTNAATIDGRNFLMLWRP